MLPTSQTASRASLSLSPARNVRCDRRSERDGHRRNQKGLQKLGPQRRNQGSCLRHSNFQILPAAAHTTCTRHRNLPLLPPPPRSLRLPHHFRDLNLLLCCDLDVPQKSWNRRTHEHTHAHTQTNENKVKRRCEAGLRNQA